MNPEDLLLPEGLNTAGFPKLTREQARGIKLLVPASEKMLPLALVYWSLEAKDYAVVCDPVYIDQNLLDGKAIGWTITKVVTRFLQKHPRGIAPNPADTVDSAKKVVE